MKLSILICTLPSRLPRLATLLDNLTKQTKGRKDVEIIYLGDNKSITVGQKRNTLLAMARGKYVTFIDDDDRIHPQYTALILQAIEQQPDVINFMVEITTNGANPKPVTYSAAFEADKDYPDRYERLPNHLMVVRKELAVQAGGFPAINCGEDAAYAIKLRPLIKRQANIPHVLYYYDFNSRTTEAQK
jgi:glycosyltransferase involved in cell wall biosynthesis